MRATYRSKYEALVYAFPKRDKRLLACRVARWILTEHRVEDPRLWEAVAVAERYAEGLATVEELSAAREAAEAAAREAAEAAVWASGRVAAWAARDTAGAAFRAASRDDDWAALEAAEFAADAAAWDADAAGRAAAWDDAYKRFFEWALELAIGEKVAV